LQLTSPGVPDTYQGDELWCFALVDPDNRRPVDYARRDELLAEASSGSLAALHPSDERLKAGVMQRLLNIRRERAALFRGGSYTPIEVRGALAEHLVAFARSADDAHAVVIAPRLLSHLTHADGAIGDWGDTEVVLPTALRGRHFRELFRSQDLELSGDAESFMGSRILTGLPFAVLLSP
jgi:(1->4)-alpha-D-glucan 1-alpha-D-glucosylmutase